MAYISNERTMADDLSRFEGKLDAIGTHLASVDITLAKQNVTLEEHVRRTGLAEDAIAGLRDDLKPIQTHVAMVSGAFKFIGILATLASLLGGILKLAGKL